MQSKRHKRAVQVVVENGKPSTVILDIEEYKEMLERLDDVDDLRDLERMRKRPLKFPKLEEFLVNSFPTEAFS